eukprot:scaffold52211_cov48-Phaeocystis_antarctica.AAC.3
MRVVRQLHGRGELAVGAVGQGAVEGGGDLGGGPRGHADLGTEGAAVTNLDGARLVAAGADAVVARVFALDGGEGDVLHAAYGGALPQRDALHLVVQPFVGEVGRGRRGGVGHVRLGKLGGGGCGGRVLCPHPARRLT